MRPAATSKKFSGSQYDVRTTLPHATRFRLSRVAALLRDLLLDPAQGDGSGRCPSRHCYLASLPLLRAGLFFRASSVSSLPASFGTFAGYRDYATGVLAILALVTARIRPLFWPSVVAFNLVGATAIIVDYYHAIHAGVPSMPGQLDATYAIPILHVPLLMITHVVAF